MARIEPVHYRGVVWCVRVPTGAFVVRRNGKVFITGNSGFPKSLDVSKAIDRAAGAKREVKTWYPAEAGGIGFGLNVECPECGKWLRSQDPCRCPRDSGPTTEAARQWQGWGTALKPAIELICLARKPLSEAGVAANVLKHGTGALNIDASRVATNPDDPNHRPNAAAHIEGIDPGYDGGWTKHKKSSPIAGRWPANIAHDGSPEVLAAFAKFGESKSTGGGHHNGDKYGGGYAPPGVDNIDIGSPARFFKACPWEPDEVLFYSSKAPRDQRFSWHPTVKPVALMEWLVSMLCPPDGRLLDPFCGTGSTLVAADRLGIEAVGIEQDAQTCADAEEKIRRLRARRHIGEADKVEVNAGQLDLGL